MSFKDADEIRKYIGGIFEAAFEDPEIGPKLVATGVVLAFEFSGPDAVLVIDAPARAVRLGAEHLAGSTANMRMDADTGNAYWQGKVNLPFAMARGRIKVSGNVASMLKLAPLGSRLYPVYVEQLRRDGRADLLV
ncbi:SCP2 sterol-binding domain-containing protein [Nocardia bovistercoris]|uniref:SCP2 sterol-binding domain-containing protein n=1 Tax=Nocardia bovistercoris TaxID=2785916 RepID=A0A931IAM1_9NOCA|nr:SCP2 sterol-binding domain-containing protein [Nocardia bovistercoris]MBH0776702.1 SCP2 sterol-binding domain-containing protein [Nocardia bovistercoris]